MAVFRFIFLLRDSENEPYVKLSRRLIAFHLALRLHSAESPHLRGVEKHWEQDSYPPVLVQICSHTSVSGLK